MMIFNKYIGISGTLLNLVLRKYLNSIKIVQFAPQVIIDIIVTSNGEIMRIFAVKRR